MIISALKVYSFATDYNGDINDALFSWQQRETETKKPVLVVKTLMEIKRCKFNSFCLQSAGCTPLEIDQIHTQGERIK